MAKANDPLEILRSDHERVKGLLKEYKAADPDEKEVLADGISEDLSLHMEMEEEIFYPNVEKISDEARDLIQEAIREHNEVKAHLSEIEGAQDDSQRDMHIDEMEKELLRHIEEEEEKIFRQQRKILMKAYLR